MARENLKRVKAEKQSVEKRLKDSIITTDEARPSTEDSVGNVEPSVNVSYTEEIPTPSNEYYTPTKMV